MLDWIRKDEDRPDNPMLSPAAAAKLLAEIRGTEPLTALTELNAWLDAVNDNPGHGIRCEILSLMQDAGGAHVSALLGQILAKPAGSQAARESVWNALVNHERRLAAALCASARALLKEVAADPSLRPAAAAAAARGLSACRTLAKTCLIHYVTVPPKLWRLAYVVHAETERAGCAGTPVHLQSTQKTLTTVTQELLKLLMLQSSAPEMMAPEQIEVADRAIDQIGEGFTLRPPGVADNSFCFDPAGERPPHRRDGRPPQGEARTFGPGAGYDVLDRLYKQLAAARADSVKAFGRDIPSYVQLSAMQHLLAFWGETLPYSPPAHSPATGTVQIIHGYGQIWQRLSRAASGKAELSLVEDGDGAPQAPETWALQEAGGDELGVEIPPRSGEWARCGDVVGVSLPGRDECWLGVIRSMQGDWGRSLHAEIAILSRDSKAVKLHAVIAAGEEDAVSEAAARQFDFNSVRAIILSDGVAQTEMLTLLVPPESWRRGCIYQSPVEGGARYLRGLRLRQRGDDYVRATFERTAEV